MFLPYLACAAPAMLKAAVPPVPQDAFNVYAFD